MEFGAAEQLFRRVWLRYDKIGRFARQVIDFALEHFLRSWCSIGVFLVRLSQVVDLLRSWFSALLITEIVRRLQVINVFGLRRL